MKLKIVRLVSIISTYLLLLCLFPLLFENCVALNRSEISFVDEPKYRLISEVYKGDELVGWVYEIYVKLKNNGDIRSQELIVNLKDAEGFTLEKKIYIDPGEIKTINFTWSTINKNQLLLISYYPSDPNAYLDQYNHGSIELNIGEKNIETPTTKTPGFEILVFILALTAVFYYKKTNNK